MSRPYFEIRADFNRETIVVYQAYNSAIADAALRAQRFVPPFSSGRATWIKPSFLWLMERSGWGKKSNQDRILAVRITRSGWEEALSKSVLTDPAKDVYDDRADWQEQMANAPVLVQWDPERSIRGSKLEYRSIQVGLRRTIIERYVQNWTVEIKDLTPLTKKLRELRKNGDYDRARKMLPPEKPYPVPQQLQARLGMD